MLRRKSTIMISVLVFGMFVAAIALIAAAPAKAATTTTAFDGTYDFTTTTSEGSYTESAFLTITGGAISNKHVDALYNPPNMNGIASGGECGDSWFCTFDGTVDSSGTATWTGGCVTAGANEIYTYNGVVKSDGTGSGTFSRAGYQAGTWSVTKTGSLGSSGSGVPAGVTVAVSAVGIVSSVAAIVIASTASRIPRVHKQWGSPGSPSGSPGSPSGSPGSPSGSPSLDGWTSEPAVVTTNDTSTTVGSPEDITYLGGAGLSQPTLFYPDGHPVPPRDYSGQQPPRCPIHPDVALAAHFSGTYDEPGSWYCPKCKGYPWGKN